MSTSEELPNKKSYESLNAESDILGELVSNFKSLKPYQFEPEQEVISDTDKSEEDSEEMGDGSQNLAASERIKNTNVWCECSPCKTEDRGINCSDDVFTGK